MPPPVTLVPLGGGLPMLAPGLDATTGRLDGRYYHVTDDGLVRRDAPTGVDRLLVSGARWFAVSRSSLVWIENGRVWAAPLPP